MKSRSASRIPSSSADLQRALDDASDARDLAKDVLRNLPDYDGSEDESTARHDMPPPSVHVHLHSEHDGEENMPMTAPKGSPLLVKIVVPVVAILISALATYLAGKGAVK